MIFEAVSLALAIATGIALTVAFIYRRGIGKGIDTACGKRIEKKLDKMQKDGDKVHGELLKEVHEIHGKVNRLEGAFDTFKVLIKK